jgi:hypothetical protein
MHKIHATAGYVLRVLRADASMLQVLNTELTLEDAIAALEAMDPRELLGCGAEDCSVEGCPDHKG